MVGDRWRDVEAGRAGWDRTFFVDYGYAEQRPDRARPRRGRASPRLLISCSAGALATAPAGRRLGVALVGVLPTSASDNPAQEYRRALITSLDRGVGCAEAHRRHRERSGRPARVLRDRWPAAELAGLELSAEGIARAQEKVPSRPVLPDGPADRAPLCPQSGGVGRRRGVQRGARTRRRSGRDCCAPRSARRARRAPRRHGAGRASHGVRPLHRSSTPLPARARCVRCSSGRARGRAGERVPGSRSSTSTSSWCCCAGGADRRTPRAPPSPRGWQWRRWEASASVLRRG